MPIPLGAVSDLLDPVFAGISDELVESQRRALSAALAIEADAGGRPDRLTLLRGLVASFRALARDAPLLLAIDDVQWLDPASARVLSFAVRRIGEEPIGVLTTLRGAADEPDPLGLADAFQPGAFAELRIGPLAMHASPEASARAVRRAHPAVEGGSRPRRISRQPDVRTRIRAGSRAGARGSASAAAGPGVAPGARRRTRPSTPARHAAAPRAVSAIERPTPALLAKALGEVHAESLVDEAAAAGALAVGSDGVVRFTHPLLGAAVYFDMPSGRRRAVHLQAAELVDDLEQEARHLALATSTPDEGIAAVVERAAEAAAERGAPDAAAILSAEAVRLTPPEGQAERVRRTFVGAGYLMEAGDVPEARARIEPLLDPGLPAAVRSQALVFRAETEHQDRPMIRAYLQEAIDIAPDPRVRWQAWIRYAQQGGFISRDARLAAESAREALRIAVELRRSAVDRGGHRRAGLLRGCPR